MKGYVGNTLERNVSRSFPNFDTFESARDSTSGSRSSRVKIFSINNISPISLPGHQVSSMSKVRAKSIFLLGLKAPSHKMQAVSSFSFFFWGGELLTGSW